MVADLQYHLHMTLDAIASLDDRQIIQILFRHRDENGGLIRMARKGEVPDDPVERIGKRAGFEEMFRSVWRNRGYDEKGIDERWLHYITVEEPEMGRRWKARQRQEFVPAAPGSVLLVPRGTVVVTEKPKIWRPAATRTNGSK